MGFVVIIANGLLVMNVSSSWPHRAARDGVYWLSS